jgi:hypothetical protein
MPRAPKAANLLGPPPPPEPQSGAGPKETGQTYKERQSKGRKEFAIWLDNDRSSKIEAIKKHLGFDFPKQVFERAIDDLYRTTVQGGQR